jgi:hypothetical protein
VIRARGIPGVAEKKSLDSTAPASSSHSAGLFMVAQRDPLEVMRMLIEEFEWNINQTIRYDTRKDTWRRKSPFFARNNPEMTRY